MKYVIAGVTILHMLMFYWQHVYHYLSVIHRTWAYLFPDDMTYSIDPNSVRLVEGLMPAYSTKDRDQLVELMQSQIIFPYVQEEAERDSLQSRLLEVPGRLLSINTLIQDTLYLKQPVRAFRNLLPKRFKGTINEAMLKRWSSQNMKEPSSFQASEHVFIPLPSRVNPFAVSMAQLWLFTLRHFVQPHSDSKCRQTMAAQSTERFSLGRMAALAHQLGFSSDELNTLRAQDFNRADSDQMLRAFCTSGFYQIDEGKVRAMTTRLQEYWRNLKRIKESPCDVPSLVTDNEENMTHRRYNSPLQDEHERDRSCLFLGYVYSADSPCARYPTSFAVTREIFFAFFGKLPFYDIFTRELNTSDTRIQGAHMNEQPDNQVAEPVNEGEEVISEPVDLQPHPPGTPDRDRESNSHWSAPLNGNIQPQDQESFHLSMSNSPVQAMEGIEQDVPLAAGFEDHIHKAPLETKAVISLHRKVAEILQMWYESRNTSLIILFMFESRSYYKFGLDSESALRSTILDLQRGHYFLTINDHGVVAPDLDKIHEVALQERLILVGKHNGPNKAIENQSGQISFDDLREYAANFDVRTGKRKAGEDLSRNAKRRVNQT